jgi:hypothetical protein
MPDQFSPAEGLQLRGKLAQTEFHAYAWEALRRARKAFKSSDDFAAREAKMFAEKIADTTLPSDMVAIAAGEVQGFVRLIDNDGVAALGYVKGVKSSEGINHMLYARLIPEGHELHGRVQPGDYLWLYTVEDKEYPVPDWVETDDRWDQFDRIVLLHQFVRNQVFKPHRWGAKK